MNRTKGTAPRISSEDWLEMPIEARVAQLHSLPKLDADRFFLRLSTHHQLEVLLHASTADRGTWLRLLPPDDAADVIQSAGQDLQDNLLRLLDDVGRREVTALMAYREDRAGGLMNPRSRESARK